MMIDLNALVELTDDLLLDLIATICDRKCVRCGIDYRHHGGADHVWYEFAEDIPLGEKN
jgi:hypothetical protein